jgi:peptidoglycan-N-acetylglucosamine deacetylase
MHRRRALGLGLLAGLSFIVGVVAGAGAGGSLGAASRAEERVLRAGVGSAPSTAVERARLREGAAIDRVLSYTSFISRGSPNKREVALTFDDGPGPFTADVLAVLRRKRTPATFFAIGEQAPDFGAALVAEVRAGYVVGDHTQTHPMMGDLSPRAQQREIEDQEILVEARGVPRQRLYRPPFGSYDRATLAILKRKRMLMVLWDIDTEDYTRPGADAIARTALEGAKPGSIILMHDGGGDRSETVAALPQIIRGLRAKGLRPVTLPELLLDDPPPRTQGLPPSLSGG